MNGRHFNAKETARRMIGRKGAGIRALRVPERASSAHGFRRLLSSRQENAIDALLRGVAGQENAAVVFPASFEFLKQARNRKSVRRARLVRSLGTVAACLVVAAAGIFLIRSGNLSKFDQAPAPRAAESSSAEAYGGDGGYGEPLNSPLCAALPFEQGDQEMSAQDSAIIPDAGNSRSAEFAEPSPGEAGFEIRMIGEAPRGMDTKGLKDRGVTVEYGVNPPVDLLPGEAAVGVQEGGGLSLYYLYNDQDTLLLTEEGADTETLFSYARQLAQEGSSSSTGAS